MSNIFIKIKDLLRLSSVDKPNWGKDENPWAGLSPYADPLKMRNPLRFYGREDEAIDLFKLIEESIVTTLYGKSGIGKTSLLNAGVFPILRQNDYAPLSIRFTSDKNGTETFAEQITQLLNKSFDGKSGNNSYETINVVPENLNPESEDYLWSFFARRRFINSDGKTIFPVLILDQFEENIRTNRDKSSLLLKQMAYMSTRQNMLKDTYVDNKYYTYNYNFRFVISIREDDLFRLEDILNVNYLTALRNGRYRLQNLNRENARLIVEKVGEEFILQEDAEKISDRIIAVSKAKDDGLIQTNVISLVCSRLYNLVSKDERRKITLEDTEKYLSEDPFEEYYTTAIKKLSEGEKRFIETSFVSTDGRRNLLQEFTLQRYIKSHRSLIDGETPIFHIIQISSDESLVELIHDGLCSTVLKHRTIRLEKKNKTILSLCLFILGLLGLWMLNVSIADNFVSCFLTLCSKGLSGLKYGHALALTELVSIVLFPIAIGSIVYDYDRKKLVGMIGILFYILPSILYPISFIKNITSSFLHIQKNYVNIGISDILSGFSDATYIFTIFSIVVILLCSINFFGKPGIKRKENYFKILWSSLPIRIYLFVIIVFLYYKSIFNTRYFIIDSSDSSWGLIAIPLLSLSVLGINLKSKGKKIAFWIFVGLLLMLMTSSIYELYQSVVSILIYLVISFFLLIILYREKSNLTTILKSLGNIIILGIVIFLNLGYKPASVNITNIQKVYPWKIIVAENSSQVGIYDAWYGDTLLIPEFKKDLRKFCYSKTLPSNSYTTDSIKGLSGDSVGCSSTPFPLALTKLGTGNWKLTLTYSPNFEHAISKLAHSKATDSTTLTNKGGAKLFIKLRNDISSFCISGNDSILCSDISYINQYEEIIRQDLSHSLHQLTINNSILTEAEIVPFIKALSRSLYMNMLKESILKKHYTDFISWYSSYFIAVALTSIASENGSKWSLHFNDNSSTIIKNFKVTIEGLNDNRVYAWNNLFHALFLLECNAYAPKYCSDIKNRNHEYSIAVDRMLENTTEMSKRMDSLYCNITKRVKLDNIINSLTEKNSIGEKLNSEELSQILKTLIDETSFYNTVKKRIHTEMNTYNDIISITDSLKATVLLLAADAQFENIITDTFNSLSQIIKDNPINAYNGLLISLCQNLYVIGVMRGYDMNEYADKMTYLDQVGTLPLYNLVKEIDIAHKQRTQLLDSLQNQVEATKYKINTLVEKKSVNILSTLLDDD